MWLAERGQVSPQAEGVIRVPDVAGREGSGEPPGRGGQITAKSPPWPSGYKRRNPTLVPVVRARFEPRCGRPQFAPTCNGVRVCGRNRTEAREREWAEGTVPSPPGTLNFRIKFCHSTGIARSGGGVRASTTSYA